jgi:hypothetical protein
MTKRAFNKLVVDENNSAATMFLPQRPHLRPSAHLLN